LRDKTCKLTDKSFTAKQASKQIVDSILIDAGENPESSEFSPSLVKINENLLDDSF
jgi:DASH complex subunit ASK1